jgi:hypothetical protein
MFSIVSYLKKILAMTDNRLLATSTAEEDTVRKVGLMKIIAVIGIVFLITLGGFAFLQGDTVLSSVDFLCALLLVILLFLLRNKNYLYFCLYTGVGIM